MKLEQLQRGMRCTYRNGDTFTFSHMDKGAAYYLFAEKGFFTNTVLQEDLTHMRFTSLDVVKVEDITENGYETIWEREEPKKYYLRLPKGYYYDTYLNYSYLSDRFYFEDKQESKNYKTQFTLSEIKNLPNQDFVQALEKEEVVE